MSYTKETLDVVNALKYCGVYAFICFLLGVGLLRALRIYPLKGRDFGAGYLGGAFFMGQGTLGALWQMLATIGFFSPSVITIILVIAGLLGAFSVVPIFKLVLHRFQLRLKETLNLGALWTVLVLLLIALIMVFAYLTLSPSGIDPLAYYLAQAKLIAATQKLQPLVGYEAMVQLGLNAEMHAAIMYSLGGEIVGEYAAIILVWVTALASAGILWSIAARVGLGLRGQWIVLIMLYTSTNFTNVIWDGKTDLFGTGLGLAAIYWLLKLGKLSDWTVFLLSGLMVGFAVNSKLSLLVVMAPMLSILACCYIWNDDYSNQSHRSSIRKLKLRRLSIAALIASGSVIIAFLPLIFKNTIVYDAPLAPFIHPLNDGILDQTWYSPENTRWIVLTYPLALFFGQYPMQYGNLSPLLFASLPLYLLFRQRKILVKNLSLRFLTISSVLAVAVWVLVRPSVLAPRYILPPLLTLLPIGSYLVEQLWQRRTDLALRITLYFAMVIMLACTIWTHWQNLKIAENYWTSPRKTFEGAVWRTLEVVNANAGKGDRICLAIWFRAPLRNDLLQCYTMVDLISPFPTSKTIWETLYLQEGVRWLVLDRSTHNQYLNVSIDPKVAPNFLSIKAYPIDNNFVVYHITPKAGAPKPLKTCIQQKDGMWNVQKIE